MEDMEQVLQENIDALVDQADSIGFRFSPNKTKCMHFCRLRRPHDEPSLTLYGNILEVIPYFKFLGVTLDQKLHWKEHVDMLATKYKKNMNIMKAVSNISWGMDREILLKMYSYAHSFQNRLRLCGLRCSEKVSPKTTRLDSRNWPEARYWWVSNQPTILALL
ncbi:hypothetical protein JTB14_013486 [Gonioctena quinquepunctata]|nr:hypothetical protein JTB14_013486 [Gonioctena quinquepunctata]